MTEDPDYPTFRRLLAEANARADLWQAHALDLVRQRRGAREAARKDLVKAGLLAEPKFETCRERRARKDKERRAYQRALREVTT